MLRYIHSQWLQLSLPDTLSNSTTQDRRMEIEFPLDELQVQLGSSTSTYFIINSRGTHSSTALQLYSYVCTTYISYYLIILCLSDLNAEMDGCCK